MPRPRKGTEEVFYDTFSDWPADDQASALKVLEAIHRQTQRAERRNGKPADSAGETVQGSLPIVVPGEKETDGV